MPTVLQPIVLQQDQLQLIEIVDIKGSCLQTQCIPDDLAMAKLCKSKCARVWCALGPKAFSIHSS